MALSKAETYRLAIIGCGQRAREHMVGIAADERIEVVALADRFSEAAETFKSDYNLDASIYTDHRELLKQEKPDIVVATLWTDLHLPIFHDCARAGVRAVLSEKPMAARWTECREIARIAEETGCLLTYCHQRRFASGNLLARRLLGEGRFGKIERMELFSPRHLLDCGTHTIDQAMSFNDESPGAWVHGAVDVSETISYFNVRAENMATGFIQFENGVTATLRVGDAKRDKLDMWSGVRAFGTEGFIEVLWDGDFRDCVVYKEPDWKPPVVERKPGEQMIGVIRNAVDCLESGAEPELSYHKALRASEVLFALYQSAMTHRRVSLPIDPGIGNPLYDYLDSRA